MTTILSDLLATVDYHLRRQVETAPADFRDTASINAELEWADANEQLLTVDNDSEALRKLHAWITVLAS